MTISSHHHLHSMTQEIDIVAISFEAAMHTTHKFFPERDYRELVGLIWQRLDRSVPETVKHAKAMAHQEAMSAARHAGWYSRSEVVVVALGERDLEGGQDPADLADLVERGAGRVSAEDL